MAARTRSTLCAYSAQLWLTCVWGAAYMFIGASLNVNPSQLGSITLARGLVQAASSPVAGLLGDRLNRCYIVSFGAILWGIMTIAIAVSTNLLQAGSPSLPGEASSSSFER